MSRASRSAHSLSKTRAAAKSMTAARPAGAAKKRKVKSEPKRLATASRTTLASRIAFLRKQHGMTLDQLADAAGLTKSYISKVERGLSVPSISTALKIAGTFDLSVGQLLGETQYDDAISLVRRAERPSFMRGGSGSGYDYEMLAPGKRFKTMEPYIMRPPLKFQDDRHRSRRLRRIRDIHVQFCAGIRSAINRRVIQVIRHVAHQPVAFAKDVALIFRGDQSGRTGEHPRADLIADL